MTRRYLVSGVFKVGVDYIVEADSTEEARRKALKNVKILHNPSEPEALTGIECISKGENLHFEADDDITWDKEVLDVTNEEYFPY